MQDGLCRTAGTPLQDVGHYVFEFYNHTQCRETCSIIPDCTAYAYSTTPLGKRYTDTTGDPNCFIYGQNFTFDDNEAIKIRSLIGSELANYARGRVPLYNPLPITVAYPHNNPGIKYFCYIKRDCPDSDADSACDDEYPFYQELLAGDQTGYCVTDDMYATGTFQVSKYYVATKQLTIPLCRQACSSVPRCTAFETHTTNANNCMLHGQEFTFTEEEKSKISTILRNLPVPLAISGTEKIGSDNPINRADASPQMRCFSKHHCRDANQNQVCDSIDACATPQTCSGEGRLAVYTRVTNENNEDGICATSSEPLYLSQYHAANQPPDWCQQFCTMIKQCSAFTIDNNRNCVLHGADFVGSDLEFTTVRSLLGFTDANEFSYVANNQTITTVVPSPGATCKVKSFCDDANSDSVCDTTPTPTTPTTPTPGTTPTPATPPPPPSSSSPLSAGAIAAIVIASCCTAAAAAFAAYKLIMKRATTQSAVASRHTYSML